MVISAFQLGGDISAEPGTYNENGSPVGVSMRNGTSATWTSYDYLKNLQGDILGICSVSGGGIVTILAAYEYDPWGKLLGVRNNSGGVISDETSIALRNPLRYRGYYYDSDTGYYYLKSRYYDPQIGRFINADGYASTGQGFIGHNMFAYCLNNPILCADESGNAANPRYNSSLLLDGGGEKYRKYCYAPTGHTVKYTTQSSAYDSRTVVSYELHYYSPSQVSEIVREEALSAYTQAPEMNSILKTVGEFVAGKIIERKLPEEFNNMISIALLICEFIKCGKETADASRARFWLSASQDGKGIIEVQFSTYGASGTYYVLWDGTEEYHDWGAYPFARR